MDIRLEWAVGTGGSGEIARKRKTVLTVTFTSEFMFENLLASARESGAPANITGPKSRFALSGWVRRAFCRSSLRWPKQSLSGRPSARSAPSRSGYTGRIIRPRLPLFEGIMFSDRSTPDDWARKSASSLERIEKSLAEVTSALQALDARQREQDAKLESLVQGGGGAPQVHDGGAAGGVGEARESGTSGGVDKRLRQSASGRPAAGPAAASEEDDGRGSSASYRRPNCRVGSVDLTAMMEEVHMKNDAARKNSTEEHGGMKHVHNNRDSRRQELKNLSKVQSEEVFGMSSTIVDAFNTRKTEVEFKRRHEQALARRA